MSIRKNKMNNSEDLLTSNFVLEMLFKNATYKRKYDCLDEDVAE